MTRLPRKRGAMTRNALARTLPSVGLACAVAIMGWVITSSAITPSATGVAHAVVVAGDGPPWG
jgi:hypothetical protein